MRVGSLSCLTAAWALGCRPMPFLPDSWTVINTCEVRYSGRVRALLRSSVFSLCSFSFSGLAGLGGTSLRNSMFGCRSARGACGVADTAGTMLRGISRGATLGRSALLSPLLSAPLECTGEVAFSCCMLFKPWLAGASLRSSILAGFAGRLRGRSNCGWFGSISCRAGGACLRAGSAFSGGEDLSG